MTQYFVDTGAFYAAKDPSDYNYQEATVFMKRVRKTPNLLLITSNFIVDETPTLLRMKLGH